MKIKVLIIMMFIGLGSVQAQSDATLEETIKWINNFGTQENSYYDRDAKTFVDYFYLKQKDNSLIIDYKDKWWNEGRWKTNNPEAYHPFKLSEVTSIKLRRKSSCYYVRILQPFSLNIGFDDEKKAQSLYNALKHLASFYNVNIEFENLLEIENKF